MPISKKSGPALVAGIADERFLLSAEQDQNRRNNGEHQPDRLIENVALEDALPEPRPHNPLDHRLERRQ